MSVNAGVAAAQHAAGLSGDSIIREINASGIEFVISVPDITTSEGLLRPLAKGQSRPQDGVASLAYCPRLVRICKEDEGVAICAGLAHTGKRGLLLIQQTGLLDSINAIRGVAVEYSLPICMMVGLLSKEPGVAPTESKNYGVRIVEPVLDAMGVEHALVEQPADVQKIVPAIESAYSRLAPTVLLIGREPL